MIATSFLLCFKCSTLTSWLRWLTYNFKLTCSGFSKPTSRYAVRYNSRAARVPAWWPAATRPAAILRRPGFPARAQSCCERPLSPSSAFENPQQRFSGSQASIPPYCRRTRYLLDVACSGRIDVMAGLAGEHHHLGTCSAHQCALSQTPKTDSPRLYIHPTQREHTSYSLLSKTASTCLAP